MKKPYEKHEKEITEIKQMIKDSIKREDKTVIATYWETNTLDNKLLVLYAGVWDNGSKRDGYAQYLCAQIHQHNLTDPKY